MKNPSGGLQLHLGGASLFRGIGGDPCMLTKRRRVELISSGLITVEHLFPLASRDDLGHTNSGVVARAAAISP